MIQINLEITPEDLLPKLQRFWSASARCLDAVDLGSPPGSPSPVFTVNGRYTAQGWTEWTQGFQYGSALLQYDATGEQRYLQLGRERTVAVMAPHLTHTGVHDHGFNNISTYGNLWRLMNEGRCEEDPWQRSFYEIALKVTGAVQASRWSVTPDGTGFIYSFNGPQSLFVDTLRSCRVLAISHQLGHVLMGEHDERINLLARLVQHISNTARYNICYGDGRDIYDEAGRTTHESIFNSNHGDYRCPSTQQGYSPFTTWTRGLAWAMLGFTEQLEWLRTRSGDEIAGVGDRVHIEALMLRAARVTCDYYIESTPACGVPYWDTGAPGLAALDGYADCPADPFNPYEPVDSSAATIAAQALLRMGRLLRGQTGGDDGRKYLQAGLTVLDTLLDTPYLSDDPTHEGLILHAIYHRPNGWDYVPSGSQVPYGEACMWGDYHVREVALYVQRLAEQAPYHTFFGPVD